MHHLHFIANSRNLLTLIARRVDVFEVKTDGIKMNWPPALLHSQLILVLRLRAVSILLESPWVRTQRRTQHKQADSPERASHELQEAASIARLASSPLVTRMSRSQSRSHAHLLCSLPRISEQKRDCSQSILSPEAAILLASPARPDFLSMLREFFLIPSDLLHLTGDRES